MQHTKISASLALLLTVACDPWGDGGEFPPQPIATTGHDDDQMQGEDGPHDPAADDGSGGSPEPEEPDEPDDENVGHPCEVIGNRIGVELVPAFGLWTGEPHAEGPEQEISFDVGSGTWEWKHAPAYGEPTLARTSDTTLNEAGTVTLDWLRATYQFNLPTGATEYVLWIQAHGGVLGRKWQMGAFGVEDVSVSAEWYTNAETAHSINYWTGVPPGEVEIWQKWSHGLLHGYIADSSVGLLGGQHPSNMSEVTDLDMYFVPVMGLCIPGEWGPMDPE